MKTFLLILLGFALYPLVSETVNIYEDTQASKFYKEFCKNKEKCEFMDWYDTYKEAHPMLNKLSLATISPGYGIFDIVTGRCTAELRNNTPRREYFQCNKVQVFLSDLLGI